jgi:hypothetical protein
MRTPPRQIFLFTALLLVCAAWSAPSVCVASPRPPDPDGYQPPRPEHDGYDGCEGESLWHVQLPLLNASAPIYQEFVDYALLSATLRAASCARARPEPDALTLRLGLGQQLWRPMGPQTPDQAWTTTSLNAEVGFYHSQLAWVQARSFLDMSWLASGAPTDPSQDSAVAQGSHRVRGQVGVGEVSRGLGVDLEVDGQLDHMAPLTLRSRPFDVLPIGHRDAALAGRLWLRSGSDSDGAFVMPITYEARAVTYTDPTLAAASPLRGFSQHTISAGVGMRPYMINGDGWFEFMGLSWHRYRFDLNDAPRPLNGKACCVTSAAAQGLSDPGLGEQALSASLGGPRFQSLEQIDVRAVHADSITLYEDDFVVSGHFFVGGSWMWDPLGAQQVAMVTGAYGVSSRFENGSVGFVFSRRPGVAPDASRPVAAYRLEWLAEFYNPEGHIGGAFRASSAWLQDLHRAVDVQTMPSQHTLHTELFFAAWPEASVGVFHDAGSYSTGDSAWASPSFPTPSGPWQHHLGAFLRLNVEPLSLF